MTITFNKAQWEKWKSQLTSLQKADAVSKDEFGKCLRALTEMEEKSNLSSASHGTAVEAEETTTLRTSPSAGGQRQDVGTQLYTVQLLHYSHHILNKVKRDRQVRSLTRRLGEMAATLYTVAQDLWRVLSRSQRLHNSSSAASRDSTTATTQPLTISTSHNIANSFQNSATLSAIVSQQSLRALETLLQRDKTFDASLLARLAMQPSLAHVNNATQTEKEYFIDEDSPEEKHRHPFLCRRCRQDGRSTYEYDKERQRLANTRDDTAKEAPSSAKQSRTLPAKAPTRPDHRDGTLTKSHFNGGTQKTTATLPRIRR